MSRVIRVPLAVDAQVRVPVGPASVPVRTVIVTACSAPLAYAAFMIPFSNGQWRVGAALMVFAMAFTFATPTREGIWIGTYAAYKFLDRLFPTAIVNGRAQRSLVKFSGETVRITDHKPVHHSERSYSKFLNLVRDIPTVHDAGPGVIMVAPGGARAIVEISGPTVSLGSDAYLHWCEQFMNWIFAVECPVQILTLMTHFDSHKAQMAFDRRTQRWPQTGLRHMERDLAGRVANVSLGLRMFVIFAPQMAERDGIPDACRLRKLSQIKEAAINDAERALQSAMRHATSFGLDITIPDRDDLASVLSQTILGANNAARGDNILKINDQHHVVMTVRKLPPRIQAGTVVDALMRARTRGMASLHIFPVEAPVARKAIQRQASMHKYAARQGTGDIDNEVAIADAQSVLASIAQREIRPCRISLTVSVSHNMRSEAMEAAERLAGLLLGDGFEISMPTTPGMLPALALSPGCAPLARSLQLTTDGVATRMLPVLGTPFANPQHPLIGISALTGAPSYLSVWSRPNHNMVIVGSSGAGKSVSTKTLLIRHVMEGVSAVVIDPDSEYKPVMDSIGGAYFELGQEALNPLAVGVGVPPDTAASMITPILSVMAGDEKGIREGRPIRRLPDEDQGWVHAQVADFYRAWAQHNPTQEPVMHHLVDYMETVARANALTDREQERCRIITSRLARFTQGKRALVFDRPSTFVVGRQPVGIGLKTFAMSYGSDLTPALACILTSILAAIDRREGRMIVVVDEAHRVTCDPDAGEVLGQLVRQARKYGAGVWMASQKIEDFVKTDLGRTLAATAATKLVLGSEEAVIEDVAEVFHLNGEEIRALNPMMQGRGVLLSGSERTVVHIIPGTAIMSLADTSGAIREAAAAASA